MRVEIRARLPLVVSADRQRRPINDVVREVGRATRRRERRRARHRHVGRRHVVHAGAAAGRLLHRRRARRRIDAFPHHNARFDIDERALDVGYRMMVALGLRGTRTGRGDARAHRVGRPQRTSRPDALARPAGRSGRARAPKRSRRRRPTSSCSSTSARATRASGCAPCAGPSFARCALKATRRRWSALLRRPSSTRRCSRRANSATYFADLRDPAFASRFRAVPPALQHQHRAELAARAAVRDHRAQRRDRHDHRQPRVDAGARGPLAARAPATRSSSTSRSTR
jgi:hypothetical protein